MLLAFTDGGALRPNPGPPATGLQIWLKADAGVATSGSNVTAWDDQSGHGHTFTSAGPDSPVLLTGGAGINGLPAIRFFDTSTNVKSCYFTGALDPSSWSGISFIYVNRTRPSGPIPIRAYESVIGWHAAGTYWAINCGSDSSTGNGLGWAGPTSIVVLGNTTGLTNSQLVIQAYRYDKTAWNMSGTFTNGPVADTSFPTGPIFGGSPVWVGTNDYPGTQNTGDTAEILVYDHYLSDADLAAAMTYANGRYTQ